MVLSQRQRAATTYGIGQMQLLPVAQRVYRRARRSADATGEIFRPLGHAKQFALRFDHFPDQRKIV
jgi:hypothetical protein